MEEKVMVNDTLTAINGELSKFGGIIAETENKELKQTFKQLRNQCEMSQEELFEIARSKSYYIPAGQATQEEVQQVKSIFSQDSGMSGSISGSMSGSSSSSSLGSNSSSSSSGKKSKGFW